MKIASSSTGFRVFSSFAVVLAIMVAMTAIALWRQHGAEQAMARLVDDSLAKQLLISEQLGALRLNGTRAMTIARSDSMELADYFKAELAEGERQQARLAAALAAMPHSAQEQALLAGAAQRGGAYLALRNQAFAWKDQGRTGAVEQLIAERMGPAYDAYVKAMENALAHQAAQARTLAGTTASQFADSRLLLLVLGAGAVAASALLAWLLTASIAGPLRRAVELAGHVAGGNLGAAIEHGRVDEAGQLFDAMGSMSATLAGIVGNVHEGARAVDLAAREIAAGNLDLSTRTEHQASALQQTAASMEELTQVVKSNSGNARSGHQLVQSASDIARRGAAAERR